MPRSMDWERYCDRKELRIDPANSRYAVLGSSMTASSTGSITYESHISMLYDEKPHIEIVKKSSMMKTFKKFWPSRRMFKPMLLKLKASKLKFKRRKFKNKQVLDLDDFNDQSAVSIVPARHVSTPLAIPLFSRGCLKSRLSEDFYHLMALSKASLSSKKSSIKSVFDTTSIIHTNATTPN